ncbi:hypothetical protein [Massilia sp. TS11]|uniref:TolB family protein n=1 Tax=Massilia sp. TS11 TaxID=2908003 RepID=UPI001EDBE0D9|nr:hypothetical protein [Massilia sp. TS11]MCG2586155.1 hypothetical protein [Massilia sp. TS11]
MHLVFRMLLWQDRPVICLGSAMRLRLLAVLLALQSGLVYAAGPACDWSKVRAAFGGAALDQVAELDYRLTMHAADGKTSVSDYRLWPKARQLRIQRDGRTRWWDGQQGWEQDEQGLRMLEGSAGDAVREAMAYNFFSLFADPSTSTVAESPLRLRVQPTGEQAFAIELDPVTCRIMSNHFGPELVARELDYRQVGALVWPMAFRVEKSGVAVRRGEFSALVARAQATPDMPVLAAAARHLPKPEGAGAVLVGPGWIATDKNEYNLSLNAAGDMMVFARSEADFMAAKIYVSYRRGGLWSEPALAPFSDPRYRDSDPWLTPDGQWMYFISDRPSSGEGGPRKDFDLWRVNLAQGWGRIEHLEQVNSDGYELGPELHDGWLYFNSSRPGGPARMALYRARLRADGSFDAPVPLAAPFNACLAQGDFTLSPDGQLAIYWCKADAEADEDLYAVRRIDGEWGKPVRLPAPFSGPGFDFTPSFSGDGQTLYFSSERRFGANGQGILNGLANPYVSTRAALEAALRQAERARP